MPAPTLFVDLAVAWDSSVSGAVTQTISNAITANATILTGLLTIYIIVSGTLTMFGRMSMTEWASGATRAAIIGTLLTVAAFTQYIQQPLMTDIPNWIAASVTGGLGAQTGPQLFDVLRNEVITIEAGIIQQSGGLLHIGDRLLAAIMSGMICFELLVSFAIWEFSRAMMGLIVGTAPFLLGLYLFRATRHITLNLAGMAVTLLILLLMMSILLAMSLAVDRAWIVKMQLASAAVDVRLDAMLNIALFFLFGMIMTVFIPIIEGRVGHGVVPGVAPLVSIPLRAMREASRIVPNRQPTEIRS
jgi:TrbL/VirB6 plasmid conjugal transfer protein